MKAGAVLVADADRPREGGADRKEVEVAVGVLIRAGRLVPADFPPAGQGL